MASKRVYGYETLDISAVNIKVRSCRMWRRAVCCWIL